MTLMPQQSVSRATVAKRRGRPGYDQESVLKIAVDVFNKHGFEATSMNVLADNLGITKSAIYHHVPSKGDLLRLALDRALDGLEGILKEPGATQGRADDRLEASGTPSPTLPRHPAARRISVIRRRQG